MDVFVGFHSYVSFVNGARYYYAIDTIRYIFYIEKSHE